MSAEKKPVLNPLVDTILGRLICEIWAEKTESNPQDLSVALYSNFSTQDLKYTSRSEKEVMMNILAPKFRKLIEAKNVKEIEYLFRQTLFGSSDLSKKIPRVDVCFEILEWLLTGFDEDELILKLVSVTFNDKISFEANFIQKLRVKYLEYMQS